MTETRDLFAEITALPRPHRIVPFPRHNPETNEPYCNVGIVVLTGEEIAQVTADAEGKVRKIMKGDMPKDSETSLGYHELRRDFIIEGILFRSVRHPEQLDKRFFPNESSVLKALTADEAGILFNHYSLVMKELGPIVSEMTEEEMEMWISKITESGSQGRFFLNGFTSDALKELLTYTASQLKSLRTDSSLPGTPHLSGQTSSAKRRRNRKRKSKQLNHQE